MENSQSSSPANEPYNMEADEIPADYEAPKVIPETTYNDRTRVATLSSGLKVHQVHRSTECKGEHCPIHNPSDHKYRHLPLSFKAGSMIRLSDEFPNGLTIDPDDYAYNHQERVILRNSAQCTACGDHVISERVHDFQRCSCKSIAVDGGLSYLRRVIGNEGPQHVDTSIVFAKGTAKS